jgi:hypothetical protein
MKTPLCAVCMAVTFFCSCGDNKKGRVIPKQAMEAVMWDMLQADAFTQLYIKKDSTKKDSIENASLQKKIFQLHQISREDFNASYGFYSSHPGEMKIMLDSITARAERQRNNMMMEKYSKGKIAE